ncbi:Putative tail protein [Psychrobacter phage D'Alembert]|nr:Putative tail protein [Psychrobacter phage D'Alembert]
MIYTIVRKDKDNNIDAVISFDSISSVDESWSATVTSQTVEYGFNISDNINIEAPTYSITAILSSYSLFNQEKEIVWDGQDFTANGATDRNSHVVARDEIIEIFKDRSVVTLIESEANSNNPNLSEKYQELTSSYNREIDTCVITSLSIGHPDQGTGAFLVALTIQKINLARIEISELEEGEKVALVRPLMQTYDAEKTKSSKEEGNIDPDTGLPDESAPAVSNGNNYAEMRKYHEDRLGLPYDKDYVAALGRSENYMKNTTEPSTVTTQAGNPVAIKGWNDSALIIKGGIIE